MLFPPPGCFLPSGLPCSPAAFLLSCFPGCPFLCLPSPPSHLRRTCLLLRAAPRYITALRLCYPPSDSSATLALDSELCLDLSDPCTQHGSPSGRKSKSAISVPNAIRDTLVPTCQVNTTGQTSLWWRGSRRPGHSRLPIPSQSMQSQNCAQCLRGSQQCSVLFPARHQVQPESLLTVARLWTETMTCG